ncbi:unnamed protein product [Candidula unifasciata]|uniref:G-protein coupled receptors family 1 profile domain-containing protein n=1 Tax=Candidula unifasciata TaxID=100452 RepID=A0A8S3YVK5_9EUPU|nr:unnamed protein product [Candidula unifasciata]
MAALYVQEINEVLNVSNLTFIYKDLLGYTTDIPEPVTIEKSLQNTRFVVQGVLTPVIVTIGLLGNFLNIIVLFQPSMRTSTNVYLLVLSLADSVFLVFNFALSILDCRKRGLHDSAYLFNPYGRFVSNYSGNVGVWVTVVFTGKVWCTVTRAEIASLSVVILALINTIPTLFELEVVNTVLGPRCSPTQFARSFSYEIGYSWWYVLVFTFIPFICLTIFNCVLIRALFVAARKRQQLALVSTTISKSQDANTKNKKDNHQHVVQDNNSVTQMSERSSSNSNTPSFRVKLKPRQNRRSTREQNKVTIMLITIVMIFLFCQLPWTALYLYQTYLSSNNIAGSSTALKIAGNICNLLQLVNASVNFYLYSCFSKRFRHTLAKLMLFWRLSNSSSPTTV